MENKPLTLKLANGKEESFENGEQMYNWWINQTNARKSKKKNTKEVADAVIAEVVGSN